MFGYILKNHFKWPSTTAKNLLMEQSGVFVTSGQEGGVCNLCRLLVGRSSERMRKAESIYRFCPQNRTENRGMEM